MIFKLNLQCEYLPLCDKGHSIYPICGGFKTHEERYDICPEYKEIVTLKVIIEEILR